MHQKTVLILGGGVGGLITANVLSKSIGKNHRIILIDRDKQYAFAPSFPWLATGVRKPEKICKDLNALKKKGIEFVEGEITEINAENKTVEVNGTVISGDFLVVAMGTDFITDSVNGLEEMGHNFYSLEGSENLRDSLKNFHGGDLVVLITSLPYKCPAAPYEMAMLLEYYCRKRKIRDKANISMYAAEPGPMGVAGKELSGAVRQIVESKGIQYFPEYQLEKINAVEKSLHFTNGHEAHVDLLAYVPTHKVPDVLKSAGLTGESGWVQVDRNTLETKFSNIFAIGDNTGIPLALGKPLPKAGVFAHYQAEVVAHNIAVDILGKGKSKSFTGDGECFIELGDGKAGFARGNFYKEPLPDVKMYKPGRHWHAGKVLFEKDWFRRWF